MSRTCSDTDAVGIGSGTGDDGDTDEWVEIDEGHEEVNEAHAYDMDDDLSEPSLGSGHNQNDTEVEVNGKERAKKGGKRKKRREWMVLM
ncbi:hypothetical protein D1007_47305 [Hordeum vulgare]|nr:hypothetical protein D1007_47305 [Hordeum vulgare]